MRRGFVSASGTSGRTANGAEKAAGRTPSLAISRATSAALGTTPIGRIGGWTLRLALLLAASFAVSVSAHGVVDLWSLIGIALAALVIGTAAAPGTLVPLLLLLAVVGLRLLSGGPRPDLALAALVALLPLIHQLCGIAAAVPGRARLSITALRPAAGRYLVAVVPVEVAVLLAILLG